MGQRMNATKQTGCFETAMRNLATDVNDMSVTVDQVVHTAQCIAEAYGPKAEDLVALAVAEARLRRWVPDMTKRWH